MHSSEFYLCFNLLCYHDGFESTLPYRRMPKIRGYARGPHVVDPTHLRGRVGKSGDLRAGSRRVGGGLVVMAHSLWHSLLHCRYI